MSKSETVKKPPKAAITYMEEFGETEEEFLAWLRRQKAGHESLLSTGGADLDWWIAFKMTCSIAGARSVIRWAGL